MQRIAYAGLARIDLPGSVTLRLTDGGAVRWGADTFTGRDATFGAIDSIDALAEGVGEEVPALELVLLPPTTTAAATLCAPAQQNSPATFWLAEIDRDTAEVTGTPEVLFSGFIDQSTLTVGRDRRQLSVSVVSMLERLLALNIGNSLSPTFHKSVWSGETGHDNATGLGRAVAWGVEAPPAPVSTVSSGSLGGYGRTWWSGPVALV